jgi:mono/diheme cytochrome c family protein
VALGLASVFGFAALSAEKPPESYSNLMKSLSATAQALRRDAAATPKDYDALSKHAAALKTAYAAAEEFWTARKADDAIQITKNGGKAAADLDTAVKAKDDAAIATSAAAATGTCMGCHAAHRIRNEDGTYEIK